MALAPTSSRGSGGSAAPTTHAQYQATAAAVADGASLNSTWAKDSGTAFFDLADPTLPVVLTAGVYAISTDTGADSDVTAGGSIRPTLTLDNDGDAATVKATGIQTADVDGPAVHVALALTYYLPAGAVVRLRIANDDGASARSFTSAVSVQRLA